MINQIPAETTATQFVVVKIQDPHEYFFLEMQSQLRCFLRFCKSPKMKPVETPIIETTPITIGKM